MKHTQDGSTHYFHKEPGDLKYYRESPLWYAMQQCLKREGYDVVKRITTKDGHLYGNDSTYYLRDRRWRFCLTDDNYMLRFLYETWNHEGVVRLDQVTWDAEETQS